MKDYRQASMQILREHFRELLNPSSYKVTHHLESVNDLAGLNEDYDLFLLDRDCTLTGYHASEREPEFEETLKLIASKSEVVSNARYPEFMSIGEIFSDLLPVSKAVRFVNSESPHLLRIIDGSLYAMEYDQETKSFTNAQLDEIVYDYYKPDPMLLNMVIDANIQGQRVPANPRVLMVGDLYFIDIIGGNLAEVDTALVKTYKPSGGLDLAIGRRIDRFTGAFMNSIAPES